MAYIFDVPRLTELLARNLGISKTAAARLIEAGRVTDRNHVAYDDRKAAIDEAALSAAGGVAVLLDQEPISLWRTALVLLHKPVGVVTAMSDTRHPTAHALLRDAPLFHELRPAGRLDLQTSGLLLWTTEGALIQRLTHPKRRVPRTYHAALAGPFQPPPQELILDDGHRPEIVDLHPIAREDAHPGLVSPDGANVWVTVTIVGGAYHEVRRLFAALGSHVLGLCRTQFGEHHLPPDLAAGAWRSLPPTTPTTSPSAHPPDATSG
jgi:16S rRNA pseudouridine516 synthase